MTSGLGNGKRLVIVFAGPRSGSNYLIGLLGRIPGAVSLSEVFNPRAVFGLNLYPELEKRAHNTFGTPQEVLRAFRHTPQEALSRLLAIVPGDGPVFIKIQPFHVHSLAIRQILDTHCAGAIFLTRNRLDQFVSLRKALAIGKWFGTDTTEMRPTVSCGAYLSWVTQLERWQGEMLGLCRKADVPVALLDYARDLKTGPAEEIAKRLSVRLAPLALPFAARHLVAEPWLKRQDRRDDPFDKIENGAELRAEMDACGVLDEALAAPQLEPEPDTQDEPPDLVSNPSAGAAMIRNGDFETLRAALDRAFLDLPPEASGPPEQSSVEHAFGDITFICGLRGSGTTLLHDQLAAHFDIATLKPEATRRDDHDVPGQDAASVSPGHFDYPPLIGPSPVRDRRQAKALATRLRAEWAVQADRPRHSHLLQASAKNLTRIGFLRSVFPRARFVVMVRDPRAVAPKSMTQQSVTPELWLAQWQAAHLAALSQMGPDCHVLRYEDFCEYPEAAIDRIGTFCGLTSRPEPSDCSAPVKEIAHRNAEISDQWPGRVQFTPNLRVWELFGYQF